MSFSAALIVGIFFGFILQKVGFTRYSKIVNVYRFTDLSVLKFMLTAIVIGSIGIYLMRDLGWVKLTGSTPTYLVGNFVGALLFGGGMALAGF
ncbi:MAG: YeeE/YedE thiosulfate transporter family protein [Anaerolineae bacterium]